MSILAIDPGTTESGFAILYPPRNIGRFGVVDNNKILEIVYQHDGWDTLAIESMVARGMPAGDDHFATMRWVGRFQQQSHDPEGVILVDRADVKLHLCGSAKAKDSNIRQRLIDMFGKPGTKKKPGPTFGIASHAWSALAVATFVAGLK